MFKPRSKFGRFLDSEGITQQEFQKASGLAENTVTNLCRYNDYVPQPRTIHKITKGLGRLGFDEVAEDFFD